MRVRYRDGKKGIELGGMLRMGAMQSEMLGTRCSLITERVKWTRERSRRYLIWPRLSERVSLPVVWAWATHFIFPMKILRVLCGYSEHQRRVQFEGCVAEPLQTVMAILLGSKWSCSLLRMVLQDALSEVTKNVPAPEVEGVCG